MSEMVERVALAMAKSDGDYEVMDHWRRRACAAIEAMREPTSSMVVAGLKCSHIDLASEWRAMIDAALWDKP